MLQEVEASEKMMMTFKTRLLNEYDTHHCSGGSSCSSGTTTTTITTTTTTTRGLSEEDLLGLLKEDVIDVVTLSAGMLILVGPCYYYYYYYDYDYYYFYYYYYC